MERHHPHLVLSALFLLPDPDRLRLLEADLPDLDLAGDLLRLLLCLLPDLPLLLLDLVRDLERERLLDLFFFLNLKYVDIQFGSRYKTITLNHR